MVVVGGVTEEFVVGVLGWSEAVVVGGGVVDERVEGGLFEDVVVGEGVEVGRVTGGGYVEAGIEHS